jgi:autophagy-related protein 16
MNSVYELVIERNNRETAPFLSVHEANATLLIQVDALLTKYELSEREVSSLRQQLQDAAITSPGTKVTSAAAKAARKYEVQLRDKLEKLQDEYNAKLKSEANDQAAALKTAKDLSDMKDLNTAQEMTIANLREENKGAERAIEHLTNELSEAKSRTDLAEKQYDGLKKTIRSLQIENDHLKKESRIIEQRVVTEKGKTVDEVNILTEMVNSLKREVDMLRAYNKGSWFSKKVSKEKADNEDKQIVAKGQDSGRKWGTLGTVLPSAPKQTIDAHTMDGTCVKYDASGTNLVATSSSDSTVKIWDTNSGTVRVTFRGTVGHSMMCCDINGSTVVGGSSDKTCRVWNLRTQRMVRTDANLAHSSALSLTMPLFFRFIISLATPTKLLVFDYLPMSTPWLLVLPIVLSKCGIFHTKPTDKRPRYATALHQIVLMSEPIPRRLFRGIWTEDYDSGICAPENARKIYPVSTRAPSRLASSLPRIPVWY